MDGEALPVSADSEAGAGRSLPPSASGVCLAITRKLRRSRTGPEGTPLLTVYPEMTAEAVMAVVRPVLEERDREIAKLRRELRDENDRILELLGGAVKDSSEEGERP